MNDPLKTFLERARDGGFKEAVEILPRVDELKENPALIIALMLGSVEAAKAVWNEENPHFVGWEEIQHKILDHIQNGDTPLEALKKEL